MEKYIKKSLVRFLEDTFGFMKEYLKDLKIGRNPRMTSGIILRKIFKITTQEPLEELWEGFFLILGQFLRRIPGGVLESSIERNV